MLPGQLNNCAREIMGAIKREWNRSHPTLTTGGTSTAFTLTPTTAIAAYVQGQEFAFKLHTTIGNNATLNVSSKGAKKIYKITTSGLAQVVNTDIADTLFVYYDTSADGGSGGFVIFSGLATAAVGTEYIAIGVTSENGLVVAGTSKITFRMPFVMTATDVRASLKTAQASGNILTIDINNAGSTILSTKLTIDNTEKTSVTAVTAPVISAPTIFGDAEITIDIDQIGDGTAAGLKVYIIGTV